MANRLIASWAAGGLVVGAVATGIVAATDAGGGGLRRLPIGAASESSAGLTTAGSLDSASTSGGSTSTKVAADPDMIAEPGIARMYRTEFEVTGDLPALDGDAPVWQLRRSALKASRVSDLATVFSLAGDPVKAPDYDAWLVGSNDGTKPALSVDGGAGHRWYFSDPGAFPVAVTCAPAEPRATVEPAPDAASGDKPSSTGASSGAGVSAVSNLAPIPDDCPTPEPPANLPSADDAMALAKDMAAKVALGSAELKWETFGDQWSSGVTAVLVLDGVPTEEPWLQVSFGGDAKVQWASGLLDLPTKAADYPRVGTSAALENLRAMSAGTGDIAVMPMTRDVAAEQAPTTHASSGGSASGPADGPTVSTPIEEVVQTVKLTSVTETLSTYYGSDEVLYLVPSYRFTDAEGGIWPVIALDDKYLASDNTGRDNTGGGSSSGSGGAVTGGAPAPKVGIEPATTPAK